MGADIKGIPGLGEVLAVSKSTHYTKAANLKLMEFIEDTNPYTAIYFDTDANGWTSLRLLRNDNSNPITLSSYSGLTTGSTSSSASACIQSITTTKGWLPPRMTTAQKNAISSPAEGLIVYDLTLHKLYVYTGAAWEAITSA